MWRRYLPLWGGAIAAGLAVGIGPTLWSRSDTPAPSEPTNAPQTIPHEAPTAEDVAWSDRATGSGKASTSGGPVSFGLCHTGGGTNCVVDGDTIWMDGQNIRIADIDTPETHDYRCPEEKALGDRATQRLHQLVNSGTVTLQPIGDRDVDGYGRKLRIVSVNGMSVGDTLVSEGLARYYEGRKQPWC
jgi:endonuclease YncB( thermonuclease family)